MSDKIRTSSWRYKAEFTYIDTTKNKTVEIKNECIKSIIIDHNYEQNCMPIIYVNAMIEKALLDHMILNINNNILSVVLYKYDELMDHQLDIECFRDTFTYFLPDDVNKMDSIDYNEKTNDQNYGDTYRKVSLGLICVKHINRNKKSIEMNVKNTSMYNIVKYCMQDFNPIVIEPFNYNDTFDQFIIPPIGSINKTLKYLNDYRVFYNTPYRFYQDFNCAYIISSSGLAVPRNNEKYTSIIFDIKEINEIDANEIGIMKNISKSNYNINVNSIDTAVYVDSLIQKSKTKIKGITSTGTSLKSLSGSSNYLDDKIESVRLNNDNEHMIENIIATNNSSNVYININKNNLDTDSITINKKYSINNIDRYSDLNGNYLLNRKREIYIRENETFVMNMTLNLCKCGRYY